MAAPIPSTHFATLVLLLLGLVSASLCQGEDKLQFNRDIRPILAESCFQCHGQDDAARQGGLRLDQRDAALLGGESLAEAIVPGDPGSSALVSRIDANDGDQRMPPAESGKSLSEEQKERLKQWIAEGAEYEGHWAFTAPVRPEPPEVESLLPPPDASAPKVVSPIDAFVYARLKEASLAPNAEAPPATLIRRLSLDITGLPPSLEEIEIFVSDYAARGERAYAEAVERLLASPHYGEKWARHWMDAARYADSDGFEKDLPRQQWLWRDWLIHALQEDKPYNEFLIEQIAGDLLPHASQSQRVATGFFRNGMVNEEGAILYEQFRVEALVDRMDCVGKAILGMTLQCAQCHSHKFDPITQDNYFGMFAMLNNTFEQTMWVYSDEELAQIEKIETDHVRLRDELKTKLPGWRERLTDWEARQKQCAPKWRTLDPKENEWVGGVAHPNRLPDHSVITLGFRPTDGDLYVVADMQAGEKPTGLRLEALTHGDLPFGGPGRNHEGTFAVSEMVVEFRPLGSQEAWKPAKLINATADFSNPVSPIPPYFKKGDEDDRTVGSAEYLIDGNEKTAWMADRGPGRRHVDTDWVAQFAPDVTWPEVPYEIKVWLKYRHGGADIHGSMSLFLARFRLSTTQSPSPSADRMSSHAERVLAVPEAERKGADRAALFDAWRSHPHAVVAVGDDASRWALQAIEENQSQVAALWQSYPQGKSVLNLAERDGEWIRETRLLERGAWDKPTRPIEPHTPAFLHAMPSELPRNRLGLAKWLADERSPTTARAYVNRVWQQLFGQGLVETAEDFGVRTPYPVQKDVLDWLAVEFMAPSTSPTGVPARPWSMKHLLRTLVCSQAYRRDSIITADQLAKDPSNKLFARGPRFRMESEALRDNALAIAGLLERRQGGPSFFPPVPPSMFETNYVKIDWSAAPAPDRYRRSVYMFRRRSMPDPVMSSFDAPNGEYSCVRRVRSNTPLAALTSLNEPVFVEAARALAMRTLREGGATDEDRIKHAFKLCVARTPSESEAGLLLDLLKDRERHIAAGWVSAPQLAFGDNKGQEELPAGLTPTQAAAWTVVSRVLLNMDETLSKN